VSSPRPTSKRLSGPTPSRRPSALPPPASPPSRVPTRSPLRPPHAPSAPINARQSTSLVLVIAPASPDTFRAVPDTLAPTQAAPAAPSHPRVRVSGATNLSTPAKTFDHPRPVGRPLPDKPGPWPLLTRFPCPDS
jgi:hypothetical protein